MSPLTAVFVSTLAGCAAPESPPPAPPNPCDILKASGGEAAGALTAAQAHLAAARSRGDEGEYILAEVALNCHLGLHPDDSTARSLAVYLLVQEHRFAEAVAAGESLTGDVPTDWQGWAFLGDAHMERGDNDRAAAAYQRAVDLRPGILLYDRIGWLRWLEGDLPGALEMAELAASSGTGEDPTTLAWLLTRLGWLHALQGLPAPELDAALRASPGFAPAILAKARVAPGPDLAEFVDQTGSIEAWRLWSELPGAPSSLPSPPIGDRRGLADYLAPREPERALALVEEELKVRHDAVTQMTRAWAAFYAKKPGFAEEARAALATGCIEPRLLHHGAVLLGDPELAARALTMSVGLLPSERAELTAMIAKPEP
ncbi:hypothetical protein LBMAG42_21740 [Deltaproteobacteria bacterium]|nr:hypothetical protein LBMAG42_21740 [Deltaproteobacteria bacterium]